MRPNMRQAGVTLVEMIVTVLVVGILSIVMAPMFNSFVASQRGTYMKKQEINNLTIGIGLLNFAADANGGQLPAPYTGSGYTSTVFNPADATATGLALSGALTQAGINPLEINDDNYASHRVRVYQRVAGLTMAIPLYFQSGPLTTLTYQFGAVYMSSCEKGNSSCNPTAATGLPGTSISLTAANYKTWATAGNDLPAYTFSTLPLQKRMLAGTAQRVDKVRDALLSYFRTQQKTAAGNDNTNWWPSGATTMAGRTPGTNQGCRDGWYSLASDQSILAAVGLAATEFGTTAWGGAIEYCRDYDPTGTKTADASPHLAAIRIHSSVSTGSAPDAVVAGNNLVLTF